MKYGPILVPTCSTRHSKGVAIAQNCYEAGFLMGAFALENGLRAIQPVRIAAPDRVCLGIYVRSSGTLDDMLTHFRKFTRVQDEAGKWYYFRFWEGQHLANYAYAMRNDLDRVLRWFWNKRFSFNILTVNIQGNYIVKIEPRADIRPHKAIAPFRLGPLEIEAFAALEKHAFDEKLRSYLVSINTNFAGVAVHRQQGFIAARIQEAEKFRMTNEKAISNFVEASLLLGRPLVQNSLCNQILTSGHHPLDKSKWVLQICEHLNMEANI